MTGPGAGGDRNMLEELKKDAADRMAKCVVAFRESLRKMRTGRASVGLRDALNVG